MIRRFLGLERRSVSFQDVWGSGLDLFGASTSSGERVNRETALQVTAVYGAVRILSDSISTLPIDTFVRRDGVRAPLRPRPAWLDDPHPDLTMADLLGQAMVSLLLDGTAYFATVRDGTGQVVALSVLDPTAVEPVNIPIDGRMVRAYRVGQQMATSQDILQVNGLMLPGAMKGCSPIVYCAETIGLALAAQRYGASFFGNGAIPGALIEAPDAISETGIRALKAAWNDIHRGAGNSNRLAVLTEGAKFTKVSLNPNEAQFLETRQFQVPDIARIFGVPPHLLADASGSTSWGSGLAEQNTAFAQYTLRPWADRIEGGFTKLLKSEGGNPRAFVKLNMEGLLRGSFPQQVDTLARALDVGIFNLDEVRAMFDKPPLPNGLGQPHRQPANTLDVGREPSAPPAPPTPAPKEGNADE